MERNVEMDVKLASCIFSIDLQIVYAPFCAVQGHKHDGRKMTLIFHNDEKLCAASFNWHLTKVCLLMTTFWFKPTSCIIPVDIYILHATYFYAVKGNKQEA